MSWARDEWKLDLPTTALKKISELENDAENLRKNKQQQQFQLENVSNALQKQKQLTADEKTINANLRREIQELTRKCDDLESQSENKEVDLRVRDNKITLLEDQLQKVRARFKEEGENNSELIKKLDEQQAIAEGKENEIKEMKKELERTKDAKDKIERELDAAKQKAEILCKENDSLKDQLRQRDELLTEHSIENEAASTTDTADPDSVVSVGSAFLEILKRENNALISDNEELKAQVDQQKSVLREKEKELERVIEKLASTHSENERTLNEVKAKEREVARLGKKLHNTEEELRKARERVVNLEEKTQKLNEATQGERIDEEKTGEKLARLNNELEESRNKIRTLETDMTQRTNQIKAKRDRIQTLEEENVQLTQELDSLRRQNNGAMDSYLAMSSVLREKDQRIKELEDDNKEKNKQLRTQGEKNEILGSENSRLKEDLERTEQKFTDTEESYRLVSVALDESRKAIKSNLDNIGQAIRDTEAGEGLERRIRGGHADGKSRDASAKNCGNCDQLKALIQEKEDLYMRKILELESFIRDLVAEKEALEQKVTNQRRSSEEFTNRVQQMVQKLETEQRVQRQEKGELEGKLRETENFFNMVKRFFTEHETLKDYAQICLRDLQQLQRFFQGCSEGAKEVISHAHTFETVAKRISLLKSLLESVVDEFARPLCETQRDPIAENKDSPIEPCIRAEMSWDNYNFERELAFSAFKGDVEDILQQLDKDKALAEKKAAELHEVKRAHMALKKVRKRSREAIERALELENSEAFIEVVARENAPKGPHNPSARLDCDHLVDVITDLVSQNREELETKMSENFKRLENTIISQCGQVAYPGNRRQVGGENLKDAIDGKFAIGELDIVKRKISDVQKSMKHLIGSLAETEKEKKAVESRMDLLNGELGRKESQYEAKCEDLKRAAKTASEHEVSLRGRIEGLTSEKDELNSELRRVVGVLKKKEVELVEKSQELKHLQATYNDEQRKMQNKMTALLQENDGLWLDLKEADKRADLKEREFKELVERLKASQGYLHSMFNSLSNMDDELQRARDIQVYSEHN